MQIIVSFCKCYILKISLAFNETIFGAYHDQYSIDAIITGCRTFKLTEYQRKK